MRTFILLPLLFLFACSKKDNHAPSIDTCDINAVYSANAQKVTPQQGFFGTVSEKTGNCMPVVGPDNNGCMHCAIKRTVRVYQYTLTSQALPASSGTGFYDSFSTTLVAETVTDDQGFYQVAVPAGTYSVVVVENGRLYSNRLDVNGGINPVTITPGFLARVNLTSTYKAVF